MAHRHFRHGCGALVVDREAHHSSTSRRDNKPVIRWWKFSAVGMAGVVVQLGALWTLAHLWKVPDLLATVLVVETALLHNLALHEAWTWRTAAAPRRSRRFLRFHLASGLQSIASSNRDSHF